MVHYYLVYRKRSHTAAVRLRDQIGVVIADHQHPPLHRTSKHGLRTVDWRFNGPPRIESEGGKKRWG